MKWMVPVNSLDAIQLRTIEAIVKAPKQNHWVKGFAGSGKTIVLTHVLKRLASAQPKVRVCFATYTHALKDLVESGLSESERRQIEISTLDALRSLKKSFDVIVADEVQDASARHLNTMRSKSGALIVAADMDQQIYRGRTNAAELKANLKPVRDHQLRDIYRVDQGIFQVATVIFEDATVAANAMIDERDDPPRLYIGSSQDDEFKTVFAEAERLAAVSAPSAILFPNKTLMDQFIKTVSKSEGYSGNPPGVKDAPEREEGEGRDPYKLVNAYLEDQGSPLQVLGGGSGDLYESDRRPMIYLVTYHSAKGLDFPYVFLPNLTEKTKTNPLVGASDEEERRIFFVALTRARERLHLSYHGEPHRFIGEIPPDYLQAWTKRKRSY